LSKPLKILYIQGIGFLQKLALNALKPLLPKGKVVARSAGVEPVDEIIIPVVVERVGQKVGQNIKKQGYIQG